MSINTVTTLSYFSSLLRVQLETLSKHVIILLEVDRCHTHRLISELDLIAPLVAGIVIHLRSVDHCVVREVWMVHYLTELVWRGHLNLSHVSEISCTHSHEIIGLLTHYREEQ